MNTKSIVIHYGEITLKKGNRAYFEDRLLTNLRRKLRPMGIKEVRKLPARVYIELEMPTPWKNITSKIRNVFGFSAAYPVCRTAVSMDDVEKAIVSEVAKLKFDSFAVQTKRANKKFRLTSPEVNAVLGAAIKEKTEARVDLKNPGRTFFVEILDREIFFSWEKFRGPGGLPTGISGHVAALLSGGIDSPVASWMMMKRGLQVSFIHFHSMPFTDQASIDKVVEIAEDLAKWQGKTRLALIPFGWLQKEIVTNVPAKYRVVLYRRFMMRIASRVAEGVRAASLVTGEALGQVASQTLSNLRTVEAVVSRPVLRPLIGMDKQEIVDKALEIGTYELSIQPHQDCCSFLQPPNPVTSSTPEELDRVEKVFNIESMVESVIKEVEWKEMGDE